jgi:hypothetical protein
MKISQLIEIGSDRIVAWTARILSIGAVVGILTVQAVQAPEAALALLGITLLATWAWVWRYSRELSSGRMTVVMLVVHLAIGGWAYERLQFLAQFVPHVIHIGQ